MISELYNKIVKDGYTNIKNEKYLWLDGMEWTTENSDRYKQKYEPIKPFAFDASGSIWGICTDNKYKGRIVYCTNDYKECLFYAESLQKAIFRNIVEFLANVSVYEKDAEYDESEIKEFIDEWINLFQLYPEYFNKKWTDELLKINENTILLKDKDTYIPNIEAKRIINKYLSFSEIDMEYKLNNNPIKGVLLKDSNKKEIKIDDVIIYFTKEIIEQLSLYCDENLRNYVNGYEKFIKESNSKKSIKTVSYKNSCNDAFVFPVAKGLWEGGFKFGKKIKNTDDLVGDYIKYYFDNNNLIFSEEYYKSELKYKVFYKYLDDGQDIRAIKFKYENNKVKFDSIYENTYSLEGNLISYILYNEYEIINAEHYFYDDKNKLKSSDVFFSYKYKENFGRITDKKSFDGRYYGNNNPMQVYKYKYFYDDVLKIINWTRFTQYGVFSSDYSAKEKGVKEFNTKFK